jgi:hypothetical protein
MSGRRDGAAAADFLVPDKPGDRSRIAAVIQKSASVALPGVL